MSRRRIHLLSVAAAFALSACATPGGFTSSSGGEAAESSGGGIQTRAISSAPATQQARNESRPLSELNTPEAIAAREEAKRSGLTAETVASATPRAAPAARPKPAVGKPAAAPTANAAAAPPARPAAAALQKGMKVRLRSGTALGARPSVGSDSTPAVATDFELGAQIYNAGGYWWYVSSGKEAGWVLQTDLQP